MTWISE